MRATRSETYLNIGKQTDKQKEIHQAWQNLRASEAKYNAVFGAIIKGVLLFAAGCLLHAAWNGAMLLWKLYGV